MRVTVQRETAIENATPSKVYIDGAFFGYGLENSLYLMPAGSYPGNVERSAKFQAEKLYFSVPGHTGVMFHGANVPEDLKGCVGVASIRNGGAIAGDLSGELAAAAKGAAARGEAVAVVLKNPFPWAAVGIVAAAAGLGFILYRRHKKRKTA